MQEATLFESGSDSNVRSRPCKKSFDFLIVRNVGLTVKITLVRAPVNPINEFKLLYGETPQCKQNSHIDYCGKCDR